ncbi:MAG TPA: hypothetical protein VFJ47_08455 [Terriglobales bacterium]|nr:hypothetical protein [Terriglobales bacterium]
MMIANHGVLENLTLSGRTATYRCYYGADEYKYWTIGAILSRART